jgi:DNA-binding GntR family transcriptional regulator
MRAMTAQPSPSPGPGAPPGAYGAPIRADSVVDLAYERIRALILDGDVLPGARLGQVELAEQLGISRTPVREALGRLTGEGLVEFLPNRGFRAAGLVLDQVVQRLEVRLLLEPGIVRLAAERRGPEHLAGLEAAIAREAAARTRVAAHEASRDFHLVLAEASGNPQLVAVFASLWVVEVGRRLLARRSVESDWKGADVAEHRDIAAAVEGRDGDRAAALMEQHIRDALRHWQEAPA